jgi:hypothetical protein
VAATLKTAGAFLFLLPSGRPRRRDDEGAAAAAEAVFFPLPFGRPGLRFSGTPTSPEAPAAWGATEVEAAAVAFAATAFPRYGRRRLRRLDLLLAPLRDLVIAGGGTARGRHDRAGFGKAKLEARGEVGDALRS